MKVLIHDYPGHAFPIELSRQLAARGHQVLHIYAGFNVTPRGLITRQDDDPASFSIRSINIRQPLQKYNFLKRWFQEREYGRLLAKEISAYRPDIVLSANTPLDAQRAALAAARSVQSKFVFWLQDLIGLAVKRILNKKLFLAGSLIGGYYIWMEKRLLRSSDRVVLITEDFVPLMRQWDVDDHKLNVIQNWAVLKDLPVMPKENEWAKSHQLNDKFCYLYAGTMGLKHNPNLLLQLALHFRENANVRVVVLSEGPGADWLLAEREHHGLDNLLVLKYERFEKLPAVLGTADVLISVLEPDAGVYSVPSKVLSYLCAQRPQLLAVPFENLVSRIVQKHNAGVIVNPTSLQDFIDAAEELMTDPERCEVLGRNGRNYAVQNFNIEETAEQFERIMRQ